MSEENFYIIALIFIFLIKTWVNLGFYYIKIPKLKKYDRFSES